MNSNTTKLKYSEFLKEYRRININPDIFDYKNLNNSGLNAEYNKIKITDEIQHMLNRLVTAGYGFEKFSRSVQEQSRYSGHISTGQLKTIEKLYPFALNCIKDQYSPVGNEHYEHCEYIMGNDYNSKF